MRHNNSPAPRDLPRPPKVRFWTSLRAAIAGRRDARKHIAADQAGHRPFTHLLAARAHEGQTKLDHWLHAKVEPVDQAIAVTAEKITSTTRLTGRLEEKISASRAELSAADGAAAITLHRLIDRLARERDGLGQQTFESQSRLAGQLSTRRHLLETARGGASAWEATYDKVAASYQRGFQRRDKSARGDVPALTEFLAWIDGDLPLLVIVIDHDAKTLIDLAMARFVPGRLPASPSLRPVAP